MKHPAGTRYSDSVIYDEATDEVVEGFQVFRQCRPDGTPTGQKSILVPSSTGGRLVGVSLAADTRRRIIAESAPELLATLKAVVAAFKPTQTFGNAWFYPPYIVAAREMIAKVEGIN